MYRLSVYGDFYAEYGTYNEALRVFRRAVSTFKKTEAERLVELVYVPTGEVMNKWRTTGK